MFSRSHASTAAILLLALSGCHKAATNAGNPGASAPSSAAELAAVDPRVRPYLDSKAVVMQGKVLYGAYNCSGCHSNGGGGMAPALMDNTWLYGGHIAEIHATIVEGRPNGMPSWKGKIPDGDIWKIATYVRSMSLPGTLAAATNNTPSQDPAPVPASAETMQ